MNQLENAQGMVDKRVKSVDDSAVNCITIHFYDGTSILLEAENVTPSMGLIGIVPYSADILSKKSA